MENETGQKVNILRTDNGLEFINKEITELTNKHGIKHVRLATLRSKTEKRSEKIGPS